MGNQQRVPSSVIRLVCDSIIDNLGEKSLRLLFNQSGLQQYYSGGELPPSDDTPSATVDELSHLFATSIKIFGARGVKPILLRAGRGSLQHFRESNKTLSALAGAAFKVLPTDAKIKLVLSRSAKIGEELLHAPHSDLRQRRWLLCRDQRLPLLRRHPGRPGHLLLRAGLLWRGHALGHRRHLYGRGARVHRGRWQGLPLPHQPRASVDDTRREIQDRRPETRDTRCSCLRCLVVGRRCLSSVVGRSSVVYPRAASLISPSRFPSGSRRKAIHRS